MIDPQQYSVYFVTGSQHLYGAETLERVVRNAQTVARALGDEASPLPVRVIWKPTVTTSAEILAVCKSADDDTACIGLVIWMHTFSPAKMWIAGLQALRKPLLHLHTQFNRDIPWGTLDMDYMNLHQSAHGGREFGFLATRMGLRRKVVVGHWEDATSVKQVADWCRVALAVADGKRMRVARFGDNMRRVAVTEGNKVSAQLTFGYEVNGYGLGELVAYQAQITDADTGHLVEEYADTYALAPELTAGGSKRGSLREAARIELALRAFLTAGGYTAFTDTFEDLHGLRQLPGIAVQRLMADGYGFGAEGDWKTAALVRSMKVMATGLPGGNSFMEDYTYHFAPGAEACLGSHMLEICPSIAAGEVGCEVHPLGIGGKEDPVRLVFTGAPGAALNASVIDLGDRFRMLVNTVQAIEPPHQMPKLPVARILWRPRPSLAVAAAAWIYGGGAHHTCYSQNVGVEMLTDFAEITGIELLVIDERTELNRFRREARV